VGPTRDLLWEHADGRAELWLMDGAGEGTAVPLLPAGTGWRLHGLVDLNSDGRTDFLWRHPNGTIAGWLMDGSTLLQAGLLVGAGTGWTPLP
jgi:hypothetical protein